MEARFISTLLYTAIMKDEHILLDYISVARIVTGMLNSVLWSKISFTNQKKICTRLKSKVFYCMG
jgi:hypothetical protein